jgi:restriction endonuclease S subunit
MKLGKLVDFSSGLMVSRKKEENAEENYKVINLATVTNEGEVNLKKSNDLRTSKDVSKYLVKPGDVIIKLSPPYDAFCITNDMNNYILSHYYCKMEIDLKRILPEYLTWYLNSKYSKKFFQLFSKGSTIRRLPINRLEGIDIEMISIKDQKNIVEMNQLIKREKQLLKKLIVKREEQLIGYADYIIKK